MASRVIAGRYRLEEALSATLMSEVWTAVDPELDRQVVVKLLAQDADRSRFQREAQAAAGLSHENIVRLFDYGDEDGRPYMVFEYLGGRAIWLSPRTSRTGWPPGLRCPSQRSHALRVTWRRASPMRTSRASCTVI